ncbi:MAG TPA: alpha/beta fold hydrolase [Gaiellales bacterium]|jgi:pimeloyl-ACP methyl ester carboxylesterase|nr:alpha/beta fold hydrolase [Gaiellales bacterium]
MTGRRLFPRALVAAGAVFALLALAVPAMAGKHHPPSGLSWGTCADKAAAAAGWQCATFKAPKDYGSPGAGDVSIAVTRLPATGARLGALFINYGGPGGTAVDTTQAIGTELFGPVNDHFDLVAFDPRGVGQSSPSIDCKVNQETQGLYSKPFITPENLDVKALLAKDRAYVKQCVNLNKDILPYVSTANVARDMDGIRAAMGDKKLNYFGFSYGTFLGATYASLFPKNYRAMVLDGPVDANSYINTPSADLREQSAGFERAIGRFFAACTGLQSLCNFGPVDPQHGYDAQASYDALVDHANLFPIAVPDGRAAVNGDDILGATALGMYAKQLWPILAQALSAAAAGDGTGVRDLADSFWANNEDGTFDPGGDRYFTITAIEQKYDHNVQTFLDAGDNAWGVFNYTYWNTGYPEINYAIWPIHAKDAFYGPFKASKKAPTVLEIATTYDPATPYRGAKRLATQLGNVRFLTMVGDGHTAYLNGSPDCIDPAVVAQIETLTLPPVGTICQQSVPFAPPSATAATSALRATSSAAQVMLRVRTHR